MKKAPQLRGFFINESSNHFYTAKAKALVKVSLSFFLAKSESMSVKIETLSVASNASIILIFSTKD